MSLDAGGLAQMTYHKNINNNTDLTGLSGFGLGGSGFGGARSRLNSKRLSVALPPKVDPISENSVDSPSNAAPRTSRSHLLAGLRTQPKTPAAPASAPYHQTEHQMQASGSSRWAGSNYGNAKGYGQGVPQTATGAGFDLPTQHVMSAGRQMYSLPEQVLAPPAMYEQEEMDPAVLQQMQMTSLYLAQRQQQLQQQLASLTAATQGLQLGAGQYQQGAYQQASMAPPTQGYYGLSHQQQMQMQGPIEVPGQPGVYLVYNPATQGYNYAVDQAMQQQYLSVSPVQHGQHSAYAAPQYEVQDAVSGLHTATPTSERASPSNLNARSFTPPKRSSPPLAEHVEPLPPPSATAFRRGHSHKKTSSLAINPFAGASADGPKTASAAVVSTSARMGGNAIPPAPMTGTFGPGAARAGEHPVRQPRGPPPLEELVQAPTNLCEGSKNFATRRRRQALDSLVKAGVGRRGASRSRGEGESPISAADDGPDYGFGLRGSELSTHFDFGAASGRKMSPIGSEMKEKRGSAGSSSSASTSSILTTNTDGGYFALSSASSSEGEETGVFRQPLTPAGMVQAPGNAFEQRKNKMMLGNMLSASAEKRRSFVM